MKKLLLLAVLSGAAVFSGTAVMTGCSAGDGTGGGGGGSGGGTGGGGGSGGKTLCSDDSQCATGHICDPGAKVCVQSCSVGQDCTEDTMSSCRLPVSGTQAVCHCSSNGGCNTAFPGTICATVDSVCTKKCSTASECPTGRDCDANGDCVLQAVDSGTPCSAPGTCGTGEICDYVTSKCVTAPACTSANAEPDACAYGDVCNNQNFCDEIGQPTCGNFTSDALYPAWNPVTANGPVIYSVTDDATDDIAFCAGGANPYSHTVHVYAYWLAQQFPASKDNLPGFKYVSSTGSELPGPASVRPSGYVASGNTVDIKITLCAATGSSITAGFYFTGGNGFCFPDNGGSM